MKSLLVFFIAVTLASMARAAEPLEKFLVIHYKLKTMSAEKIYRFKLNDAVLVKLKTLELNCAMELPSGFGAGFELLQSNILNAPAYQLNAGMIDTSKGEKGELESRHVARTPAAISTGLRASEYGGAFIYVHNASLTTLGQRVQDFEDAPVVSNDAYDDALFNQTGEFICSFFLPGTFSRKLMLQ